MTKPYKIKDAKVTTGHEVEVTIKCTPNGIDPFECNPCFPYDTTIETITARLDEIAVDEIETRIKDKENQHEVDENLKIKELKCKNLKDKVLKLKE